MLVVPLTEPHEPLVVLNVNDFALGTSHAPLEFQQKCSVMTVFAQMISVLHGGFGFGFTSLWVELSEWSLSRCLLIVLPRRPDRKVESSAG